MRECELLCLETLETLDENVECNSRRKKRVMFNADQEYQQATKKRRGVNRRWEGSAVVLSIDEEAAPKVHDQSIVFNAPLREGSFYLPAQA